MVYCKYCKEEVEAYPDENKKWRCIKCNKYVQSPEIKGEREFLESRPQKEMGISKTIKLSGIDLHRGELLIESGYAEDFSDLVKKSIGLSFSFMHHKVMGEQFDVVKPIQEPDPKKIMKEIQEQEMMSAYIEHLRGGNKTDPLLMMILLKLLDTQGNDKKGENHN